MAEVAGVVADLKAALESLGKAQSETAAADSNVSAVQARTAATGFQGVARRLASVREQLRQAQGRESGIGDDLQQALSRVSAVTDDMTPGEVVSSLSPVIDKSETAGKNTMAVMQELNKAKSAAGAALEGGQPGPLVASIDRPIKTLGQVNVKLRTAKSATEKVIAQARQSGNF